MQMALLGNVDIDALVDQCMEKYGDALCLSVIAHHVAKQVSSI